MTMHRHPELRIIEVTRVAKTPRRTLAGLPIVAWLGFLYAILFVGLISYASGAAMHPEATSRHTGGGQTGTPLAVRFNPPTKYPKGPLGQAVKAGQALFNNTVSIAGNKLSCSSCHVDGGTSEQILPLVGVATKFPAYNSRAKAVIDLTQRIDACVQYSEAGHPLPLNDPRLIDLTAYVTWLSTDLPIGAKLPWLKRAEKPKVKLSPTSNLVAGAKLYEHVCYYCHGTNGQGFQHGWAAPPLWGPESYAQGAGMSKLAMLTNFIKTAMPVAPVNGVKPGSLTEQQAQDIAAFVLSHPRPKPGV
jgi:thiosulfate dehydrogenase